MATFPVLYPCSLLYTECLYPLTSPLSCLFTPFFSPLTTRSSSCVCEHVAFLFYSLVCYIVWIPQINDIIQYLSFSDLFHFAYSFQACTCFCKQQNFILFVCMVDTTLPRKSTYTLHLLYSFTCWWALEFFPYLAINIGCDVCIVWN